MSLENKLNNLENTYRLCDHPLIQRVKLDNLIITHASISFLNLDFTIQRGLREIPN